MPSLLIRQCECRVLLRIHYVLDVKKQVYTCGNCQREIELIGTIVEMYACKVNRASTEREWVKVPSWRIKDDSV